MGTSNFLANNTYFQRFQADVERYAEAEREYFQSHPDDDGTCPDAKAKWCKRRCMTSEAMVDVYYSWKASVTYGASIFEMRFIPKGNKEKEWVEILRAAGITEFAISSESQQTGLIALLHRLEKAGCKMKGLCTVKYSNRRPDNEGILLSVNEAGGNDK